MTPRPEISSVMQATFLIVVSNILLLFYGSGNHFFIANSKRDDVLWQTLLAPWVVVVLSNRVRAIQTRSEMEKATRKINT